MAEDRNTIAAVSENPVTEWRPFSGMAEDRNPEYCSISPEADISGGHPPGWPTFSQAELTTDRVITRCITRLAGMSEPGATIRPCQVISDGCPRSPCRPGPAVLAAEVLGRVRRGNRLLPQVDLGAYYATRSG
jgi:hypothetical protein